MFNNLLIATDGSELSNKALDVALTMAKANGGTVTVVTVTDPVTSSLAGASFGQFDAGVVIPKLEEAFAETARKILAAAKERAHAAGVDATTLHLTDHLPAEGIIQTATERGSDIIVMGSHGRRGLNRLLLGSQAAEVLARSSIPVLVVK